MLVTAQTGERKALCHNALTRKGRIAVQQDRQNRRALGAVIELVLLGAHLAQHNRVHRLKVRGVGGQRQVDLVAVKFAVRGRAEVIFHIARAIHVFGLERLPP